MNERSIYQDIPGGKNSFHSAVLTSFSFNLHHFENQVLRTLKQKWINSVNILVDQRMLDQTLGITTAYLSSINQSYSVSGIPAKGAFHPKINFFIGDQCLLVVFGSGNISAGGHGKNHELFAGLYASDGNKEQLPLILETWEYIISISQHLEGYAFNRICKELPGACSLLQSFNQPKHKFHALSSGFEIALLYNNETSVFDQLCDLIPPHKIQTITIVCPYYDESGETLINLLNQFPNSIIDVYLQRNFGLPPVGVMSSNRLSFFDWDKTDRGKTKLSGSGSFERKLHGKLFHFQADDTSYCLFGSANATLHGLGGPDIKPVNHEFSALYKFSDMDLLHDLGISGRRKHIGIKTTTRPSNISGDLPDSPVSLRFHIKCVDMDGSLLKIYLSAPLGASNLKVVLYDIYGEECFASEIIDSSKVALEFRLLTEQLEKDPAYCNISDSNGQPVSNKQIVNNVNRLELTNPSKGNRNIRKIINSFSSGNFSIFDVVNYINEINSSSEQPSSTTQGGSSSKHKDVANEKDITELTYEEAITAAKNPSNRSKIINSNPFSQFWENLDQLFKLNATTVNEELMDEEEEADAVESRERKSLEAKYQQVVFSKINATEQQLTKLNKLSKSYLNYLTSVSAKHDHIISILDCHYFLLITYLTTNICNFTEYTLPEEISTKLWQSKLNDLYRNIMHEILDQFTKLCLAKSHKSYERHDNELSAKQMDARKKVASHVLLDLYLIQRKCGQHVVVEKNNLIALNILNIFDLPPAFFREYVKSISNNFYDAYFSPESVFRFYENILSLVAAPNSHYLYLKKHGFCVVKERRKDKIRINSIYGSHLITEKYLNQSRVEKTSITSLFKS